MNGLQKTYQQFLDLYAGMTASQRMMLVGVTVMIAAGLGGLMASSRSTTSYVPLSVGKAFTVEEIIRAEESLISAGLTDFRREGQRILVPQLEVDRYNSALIASGTLPQNWAEEWEKQFSDLGPFANGKQMTERKEIARAKLASQMISALPDVESANVVWDEQETARWPSTRQSTATVFVRSKPGRELTVETSASIREAIAGMKADLPPGNVTVFDINRGVAHQASQAGDPFDSGLVRHINNLKDMYRREVLNSVDYIDHVRVSVSVDLDRVKSAVKRRQEVQTKGAAALVTTESKRTTKSQQTPRRTEPGQNPNGPLDLAAVAGEERSESMEESDTANLSAPSYEITQEDLLGAMPQNVQVAISIPEDYYRAVAVQSERIKADAPAGDWEKLLPQIRTEVNTAVSNQVSKIIPTAAGEDATTKVVVSSFTRIPRVVEESASGWSDWATLMLSRWGSTMFLGLLALYVWRQISRSVQESLKKAPPLPDIVLPVQTAKKAEESAPAKVKELPKIDTGDRDSLQVLVRDNPEMTASILAKWIAEAK